MAEENQMDDNGTLRNDKDNMSWRLLQMDWCILLHCDLFYELF